MDKTYCARNFSKPLQLHQCTGGKFCKGACAPADRKFSMPAFTELTAVNGFGGGELRSEWVTAAYEITMVGNFEAFFTCAYGCK